MTWSISPAAEAALARLLGRRVELRDIVASIYLTDEDRQLPDGRWAQAWRGRERLGRVYLGVIETHEGSVVARSIVYVWPPHDGAPGVLGASSKPSADCQRLAHLAQALDIDTTPADIRDMSHAARDALEERVLRELPEAEAERMGRTHLRHWRRMRDRWTRRSGGSGTQ